jgi:DNA-binding GntR family transcriptional regulator
MGKNVEAIYQDLTYRIINLDLLPGQKIKEEEICEWYHISRTPIRGVIARLQKDGLVEVKPQKGTYVSKIDVSHINDYIFVRIAVEKEAIASIGSSLNEEQIFELEQILLEQEQIITLDQSVEKSKLFFQNDNLFHATIFKFASLDSVWELIQKNAIPLSRARIVANLRTNVEVASIYQMHSSFVECLKKHQIKEAQEIFEKHLREGFSGINEVINKYNDYFM